MIYTRPPLPFPYFSIPSSFLPLLSPPLVCTLISNSSFSFSH